MNSKMFVPKQAHIDILSLLVENLNKNFTKLEIAKHIGKGKSYKNVRENIKTLVENKIISTQTVGASILCLLNFNEPKTIDYVTFIENTKKYALYKKNPLIKEICERFIGMIKLHTFFFSMVLFGSYAKNTYHEKSDIDLLIITDKRYLNIFNKEMLNLQAVYTKKINMMAMTKNDYEEMLISKEKINVGKESLNNHILLYGSELYLQIVREV